MATNSHNQKLSWALENLIYINKTLADIHTLNVTLLQSAEYYREEGLFVRTSEVKFPTSLWYSVGDSDTSNSTIRSSFQEKQIASYMARFNYSLMDKYLLTLTGRWDGASVLAKGNKWDFFPSMALAWKIDQEEFMERHRDWLTTLKFRIGYGVTGNAAIKPYQTGGSMASTYANQPFGIGDITSNTTGVKAEVLPNLQLGWEKTVSTNVGLDFGFLDNRINGSVEYYVANTSDLLLNRSIPLMTGYTTILANIGKTRNKGWEITLSTTNIRTRNFSWRTDFTFSTNKEKIVELADGKEDDTANGWFIGKPIDAIWTYKYDRLWQDTQEDQLLMAIYKANGLTFLPGQAKLVDQELVLVSEGTDGSKTVTLEDGRTITYLDNGFGVFNNDDNHFLGSYQPKWVGGINTVFTYKNWELNSFIYTRLGNMYYGLLQTYGRRVEKDIWSETNPGGKYPQPRSGGTSYTDCSKYMSFTKGNMFIVRNIGLSYNFPQSLLKKYKVGSLQLYGQVLNPFIWGGELVKAGINPDDTTGWTTRSKKDDYTSIVGGQSGNTAITRSYVLGVRIGF
ncbi:MAG: TonB-dependent receptor [Bacteroides sp.]|nr:TonB-dependent receptor [Bacteroides sp.]